MLSPRHLAIGAFVVWVLIDAAIVFRWKTGASENRDRRSLGVLMLLSPIVCIVAIQSAFASAAPVRPSWLPWVGLCVMASGIALRFRSIAALGDWRSFALLVLLMPLPYLFRIREEEAALAAAFGTEYAAYRRRTKRLIPGIY